MIREITRPQTTQHIINIPKEYIDKEIEILVFPIEKNNYIEQTQPKKNIFVKTAGLLQSKNIDPLEWQNNIRKEWDRN